MDYLENLDFVVTCMWSMVKIKPISYFHLPILIIQDQIILRETDYKPYSNFSYVHSDESHVWIKEEENRACYIIEVKITQKEN